MDRPSTGLVRLNLETRAYHAAADSCWLDLLARGITRGDYIDRLVTTYGFEAALEAALAYTPGLKACVDLRQRSRAGLIAKDLLSLGLRATEVAALPQSAIAPFGGPIEAFGWLYASERVTLLHERVRQHLLVWLPSIDAHAYLTAYDGVVNARWSELGHAIDRTACRGAEIDEMIAAAKVALGHLAEWISRAHTRSRRTG